MKQSAQSEESLKCISPGQTETIADTLLAEKHTKVIINDNMHSTPQLNKAN